MLQLGFHIAIQLQNEGKHVTQDMAYAMSLAVDAALKLQAETGVIDDMRKGGQTEGPLAPSVMDQIAKQMGVHLPPEMFPPKPKTEQPDTGQSVVFQRGGTAPPQLNAIQKAEAPPDPFSGLRPFLDRIYEFSIGFYDGELLFLQKEGLDKWLICCGNPREDSYRIWNPICNDWTNVTEDDHAVIEAASLSFEVAWDIAYQLAGDLLPEKQDELTYGEVILKKDSPAVQISIKQFLGMNGNTWAVIARRISPTHGVLESSLNPVGGWEPIVKGIPAAHSLLQYETADRIARALVQGDNATLIMQQVKEEQAKNDSTV